MPFLRELKIEADLRPEAPVVVRQAQRDRKIIQVEGIACVATGHLEATVLFSGVGVGSTGDGCSSGRKERL